MSGTIGGTSVKIGLTPFGAESRVAPANIVDEAVVRARQAKDLGIDALWFSQRFESDSIALAGHVGRAVPEITVGTAVVPIPGLHPLFVSGQAQTAQAATGGRFTLGLGLGWDQLARDALGVVHDRTALRLREFLTALRSALDDGHVDYHGELVTAVAPHTTVPGAQPPPSVLVAAMAPRALAAAGELTDGTITFLAAPEVIAEHITPVITAAASAAGRSKPRVVAMVSAIVTDDLATARAAFEKEFAVYDLMPSYIRVVSMAGASKAAELAVFGDEETVASAIRGYVEAGVDEIIVSRTNILGNDSRLRTWRLLGDLSREYASGSVRASA